MQKITISKGCTKAKVDLLEYPGNPYRTLLGHTNWLQLTPEERFYEVRKIVESGGPELSKLVFKFRVLGLPRHQFAQHVRARIGVDFHYSDPEETPTHFIPYTPVYEKMFLGFKNGSEVGGYYDDPATSVVVTTKEGDIDVEPLGPFTMMTKFGKSVVEQFLSIPDGPWSRTRDYLPLCYEQPYSFEINYRALLGQCARRLCLGEEAQIVTNHYLQKKSISEKFPFLAAQLRAACLKVGKCLYAKSYSLSNAFGCLFAGCDYRFPRGTDYASFNKSCSDISTLRKELPEGVVDSMDSLEPPDSYDDLKERDVELLSEA